MVSGQKKKISIKSENCSEKNANRPKAEEGIPVLLFSGD